MKGRSVHSSTASDAAVVLPLFGVFLLMPPIITLFASGLDIQGVPLIVVYVFSVWIALIVCAALLAKRLDPMHLEQADSPEIDSDIRHR
jgi:O-antigen/teichoic acid export membrane protein